ncbi:protein YdgH [Escherichia coli]|uniref:Protein YdgH n=1 Tax=Escherichia coli TaxID=562 RepID=A0A376TGG1_ECOLX|nr:protein YdgH [Escherichia coli]
MMVPFDSIKFSGNYGNMTEVSYQVANVPRRKVLSITTSPASGRNVVIT